MEKEAPRTVRRLTPALCVLAGLSLLLMLCLLSISSARSTLPQAGLNFGQVEPLAQGWQLLGDNGRWSDLASLPRQLETQQGEAVLRVALPHSVPSGTILSLHNQYQAVEILGPAGQRLFEYGLTGAPPFGSLLANRLCMAQLPALRAGQFVTVRLVSPYGGRIALSSLALGSNGALLMAQLSAGRGTLLVTAALVLLSLCMFTAFFTDWLRGRGRRSGGLLCHAGLLCLLSAVWLFTDSSLSQLFFHDPVAICLLSFFSFMLLPVFFLGCIHALCSSHTRLVRLLQAALLANLLVQGLLQAAGVLDLPQMLPATHALLAVSVFAGLYVLVSRLRRTHSPALRWLAAIYGLLAVAGLAALVEFYLRPYTDNSRLFRVGLYLGLGLLAVLGLRQLLRLMRDSRQARTWHRLALVDPLTGLGSRAALEEALNRPFQGPGLAFMMDLNNLKLVNDTLGHAAGDELLRAAAACIRQAFEPVGQCFRFGGDEFAVLLNGCQADPQQFNQKLADALQAHNAAQALAVSLARGWSEYRLLPGGGADQRLALRRADQAMYADKQRCRVRTAALRCEAQGQPSPQ